MRHLVQALLNFGRGLPEAKWTVLAPRQLGSSQRYGGHSHAF